jgi:hypothetical protein
MGQISHPIKNIRKTMKAKLVFSIIFFILLITVNCYSFSRDDSLKLAENLIQKADSTMISDRCTAYSTEASAILLYEIRTILLEMKQQNNELINLLKEKNNVR